MALAFRTGTDQERALPVGSDAFAAPSAKMRFSRIAVARRVVSARLKSLWSGRFI
jgi:hypothetical protein